ncbi:uncharacterized protein LOC142802807 [Rhipicephalus microplus]|uniref:uncharacterized protein LOC142802807 n=1 Tax=Rhipicephalus microplus TaxID=6941 RepID=UPI003F6A9480
MVYGLFSGFLIVLILIAIVAYIISFTSPKSPAHQPLVLCYYDPTMSTSFSPAFTRSNLCIECCSYLIYDGLEVDAQAEGINDWLMLKEATKMKVLCGLRFMPAPGFADPTDPRIKQIVESLSSTYAPFDGAAFMWNSPETKQEIMLYENLRTYLPGANYKIIAHILPAYLDTYDFANMNK